MRLQISKTKNAQSFYIVESTYINGRRSNRVVEKLGTLEEIKKKIGDQDPYEWGKARAKELTEQKKNGELQSVTLTLSQKKQIPLEEQRKFQIGYLFPQQIYSALKLPSICRSISRRYDFKYDLNAILSRLIYDRLLQSSSKRGAYEFSKTLLEKPDFELHDIYRALEVLAKESDTIQKKLYENSQNLCKRNTRLLFYDCTNFFFEIEQEDAFRKYGHSKENRPNPIVQMGLFLDGSGLPLAFSMTPGNQNEQTTLKPLEQKILRDFGLARFIVCTDAGLASESNRRFNDVQDRAFITTQSLKNLERSLRDWALDPSGWKLSGESYVFDLNEIDPDLYRDCIFYKKRPIISKSGFEQDLIVSYSLKYKDYQASIRQRRIDRALHMLEQGETKITRKGLNDVRRYIKRVDCTEDGEVADRTRFALDRDTINEDAKYDGFYAICTDLEADTDELLKINRQRWEIEAAFRTMKTEFKARPVYLQREDRITAHFLTCFLSLLILRILQDRLDHQFTSEAILDQLKDMEVLRLKDIYVPAYDRTKLTDALHESAGFWTDTEAMGAQKMRKIISMTKQT